MLKKLSELFDVTYGNKLDLNKMNFVAKSDGGINFVGRSSRNHGVSAVVMKLAGVAPWPAGAITVSLGGTKLLSAFVQMEPFYTAQNVAVLQAKSALTFAEKVYVCLCIRHNRFRYSAFGREANRTIKSLLVPAPETFPAWLSETDLNAVEHDLSSPAQESGPSLKRDGWGEFSLSELFELKKGKRLTKADMGAGDTPFIGAIAVDNGVRERISAEPLHPGNLITVSYNGSVGEAFYQPEPFWASDDINVLYPRFSLNPERAMFLCTIIRREKSRFSYGRKWKLERMSESRIKLPVDQDGKPDWAYMESFIKALPYSARLE